MVFIMYLSPSWVQQRTASLVVVIRWATIGTVRCYIATNNFVFLSPQLPATGLDTMFTQVITNVYYVHDHQCLLN